AYAHAVPLERRLMSVDERHALRRRITTDFIAVTGCQHFDFWQKLILDELRRRAQPIAIGAKGRMDIQTVATARARFVVRLHRRVAVGDENDAAEIAADI